MMKRRYGKFANETIRTQVNHAKLNGAIHAISCDKAGMIVANNSEMKRT